MAMPLRNQAPASPQATRQHGGSSLVVRWSSVLATALSAAWAARRARRRLRRTEAILEALDDRMLKDLGLHRCEIGSALAHPEDRAAR